ncbi:grl-9 [Pristionchus pacificus]|uniref:Grl-9 n=1 Tax=Pristionchus pacificus TaxID=54126 RepID=A0A2A6CAA6_PRIPA|nr:grl-9 [Pristionchus pacificus]|eukprot:PDM74961.1 grl-9 [Pristionchus pacificus]
MRSIILLAIPTVILAGPFCMCPNGQPGQALSCPAPKEPSCPEPKPCGEEKKPFSDFEMPSFPTLPPLDTKRMFGGFSMPTLPPSLNFFPNLFESTTTESPDTPAPTAPPPPPAPMEPQTLPPFVNPTLAPYNQRVPIGVPGTQQFAPMGEAVVSGATEAPMASSWRSNGGRDQMMMGQMNQVGQKYFEVLQQTMQQGQQMTMQQGGQQLLSGTISSSEDDMELVQPQTYKKSFHLYEADKGRVPHSIEHEIRDFGAFRNPVKRAAPHPEGGEVSSIEKCNDERLKKIIHENIDNNPSTSKRAIQKAASEQIGGLFDVICSTHDFSYLANTQLFCEAGNDDVTCFAFLHTLLQ